MAGYGSMKEKMSKMTPKQMKEHMKSKEMKGVPKKWKGDKRGC